MNPLRKKRLLIILAILVGVACAVALALSALQQNINLFYTPTQIANGEAPQDTRIRAGSMHSLHRRRCGRPSPWSWMRDSLPNSPACGRAGGGSRINLC